MYTNISCISYKIKINMFYYQGNYDPYILIGHFIYGELIVQPTFIVYSL